MAIRIAGASLVLISAAGAASAGMPIPVPAAGVAGPVALLAAIGAVVGIRYLRKRSSK